MRIRGERNGSSRFHGSCCANYRCACCQKRYLTAVLCSLGFVITFGFRCSIGVTTGYFRRQYNGTVPTGGVGAAKENIRWSTSVVGTVESSYFWGYFASQIPGGIIANRYSATGVFSMTTLASSVLNLFLPIAIRSSFELTIFIRVLQGLLEGCLYPACHGIWSHWAPPLERSRLATIAFSGGYVGAFLGLLLSGLLTESLGWSAQFYIYGAVGILWFCAWLGCVYERPSTHPCITDEERTYIEKSIGETMDLRDMIRKAPWTKFFTSMPVYAIIVANFARNWTFYLLITEPTKYFDDVFKYDTSKSGIFSALPHLIMAIVVPIGGQLADELRKRVITTTAVRKILNSTGFGLQGAFLLGVGYTSSASTAIVCLAVAVGFSGLAISGFNVNHLDIAPRYASFLMGLSNGIGSVSCILVPLVTVQLVKDRKQGSWSMVFLITSLINFASVIFYAVFASGEKQPWAEATAVENEEPWKPQLPSNFASEAEGEGKSSETPLFPTVPEFVQKTH